MPAEPVPDTAIVNGFCGPEHRAKLALHLVHDLEELGVEVAEQRGRHGAQHARVDHARARVRGGGAGAGRARGRSGRSWGSGPGRVSGHCSGPRSRRGHPPTGRDPISSSVAASLPSAAGREPLIAAAAPRAATAPPARRRRAPRRPRGGRAGRARTARSRGDGAPRPRKASTRPPGRSRAPRRPAAGRSVSIGARARGVREEAVVLGERVCELVLHEWLEEAPDAHVGEDRVPPLLEPEDEVSADRVGRERRRSEVALLDAPAAEQDDALDAHRRGSLEHLPEDLRAGQREEERDRRRGRWIAVEDGAEHDLGRRRARPPPVAHPAADDAHLDPVSRERRAARPATCAARRPASRAVPSARRSDASRRTTFTLEFYDASRPASTPAATGAATGAVASSNAGLGSGTFLLRGITSSCAPRADAWRTNS